MLNWVKRLREESKFVCFVWQLDFGILYQVFVLHNVFIDSFIATAIISYFHFHFNLKTH